MIGQHYFTWCADGEGCDRGSGFQTRAQSPSISKEIRARILQQVSRYELPQSLRRLQTKGDLTSQEFQACPVKISAYPVVDGLWGLSRVCFDPRQRGRTTNNFFAHTLIFPQDTLKAWDYNPFALGRSGIFQDRATSPTKELRDLAEFPPPSDPRQSCRLPTERRSIPHREVIPELVACLSAPEEVSRSVIVCGEKWGDVSDLIEAAILLLPPAFRTQLGFSTYELDPYRVLPGKERGGPFRGMVVGTVPGADGGNFQFRQDEYQTVFYVFNLCDGRKSTVPSSEYARHVGEAARRGNPGAVRRLHTVVERLGFGAEREAWHGLIPAASLVAMENDQRGKAKETPPRNLGAAIGALTTACVDPARAQAGFELLWGRCHESLLDWPAPALQEALSGCADLLGRTKRAEDFGRENTQKLIQSFSSLLMAGRYLAVEELLRLAGKAESETNRKVLCQGYLEAAKRDWPTCRGAKPTGNSEYEAFVRLVADGLDTLAHDPEHSPVLGRMIAPVFSVSGGPERIGRTWEAIGHWTLEKGLHRVPRESIRDVCAQLESIFFQEEAFDPQWQILFWQFRHAMPPEKERPKFFARLASAARASSEPVAAIDGLLVQAERILQEPDVIAMYVSLVGRADDDASREVVQRYHKLMGEQKDEHTRWEMRRKAAAAGGVQLVAGECVATLFPWESRSGDSFGKWIENVLHLSPRTALEVARGICARSQDLRDRQQTVHVLTECLQTATRLIPDQGPVVALFQETLAKSIPLASFDQFGIKSGEVDVSRWSQGTRACVELAHCIKTAPRVGNTSRPDLVGLRRQCPKLPDLLSQLDDRHWNEACCWLVSGLRGKSAYATDVVRALILLVLHPLCSARKNGGRPDRTDAERPARVKRAVELVADRLCHELVDGRFRKDRATQACSLAEFVCTAVELAPNAYVWEPSPAAAGRPSIERLIAGVVGRVLADASSLPGRLVWRRAESHAKITGQEWKRWSRGFRREVRAAKSARDWEANVFLSAAKRLGRIFTGQRSPRDPWEFDQA